MAIFHRLVVPTYDGGLPAGYDLINDPSHPSVGGSGVAVAADGIKSGGPNDGSYFVTFGEDARSSFANRGLQALALNTDYLDDLFHRDIAMPTRTNDVVAGGVVTSIVITGDVFVGASGLANTAANRNRLVQVLDENDDEIIDSTGATVSPSLIHDGASNNVVGVKADGFRNGSTTVNLSPGIPAGKTYRLYYGIRGNLATIPIDALTDIKLRTSEEVDGRIQDVLRRLHAEDLSQPWDFAWSASNRALAAAGLNERYRRSTSTPGSFSFNSAGNGAVITRDGRAPEATDLGASTPLFADPLNALWVARPAGSRGTSALPDGGRNGATGFVAFESRRSVLGTSTNDNGAVLSAANFLAAWPHDFGGVVAGAKTQVTPTSNATLNTGGGFPVGIRLHSLDFFHTGGKSAVAVGYDLLEVTRAGGNKEIYVIGALDPALPRDATLICVDNTFGPTFPSTETVQARWISLTFMQGGAAQKFREIVSAGGIPVRWDSFVHIQPPYLTSTPSSSEAARGSAFFFANSVRRISGIGTPTALEWGGFEDDASGTQTSTYVAKGKLYGDGSIDANLLALKNKEILTVTGTSSSGTWDPRQDGAIYAVVFNYSGAPGEHTITFAAGYTPQAGEIIYVICLQVGIEPGSIIWPSEFLFSGLDATPAQTGAFAITKYEGIYLPAPIGKFMMTKTRF